ncbi:MAG: hypothetical protein ACYDCK_07520 [Thermoplasmatota archaeon]
MPDARRLIALALALAFALPLPARAGSTITITYAGLAGDPTATTLPLAFDVSAGTAQTLDARLFANWTEPDGTGGAFNQSLGPVSLAAGTTRLVAPLDTSPGAGTYVVDIELVSAATVSAALRELTIVASGAAATATTQISATDYPTTLAFTNDSVNSAGKTKNPGDALVTRVHLADRNGLDDVARLTFRFDRLTAIGARQPVFADNLTALDSGNASVVARDIEEDFTLSPLKEGAYVENVTACSRAGASVSLERAFTIANMKPFLAAAASSTPADAASDGPLDFHMTFPVADKNLGTGPLDPTSITALDSLQVKVFRGSAPVTDTTWKIALGGEAAAAPSLTVNLSTTGTLSGRFPYNRSQGAGVFGIGVDVSVPTSAAPGSYRASLYHLAPGATALLLGSASFTVDALPTVTALALDDTTLHLGHAVHATFATSGHVDHVVLRLLAGSHVIAATRAAPAATDATLDVPASVAPGDAILELLAAGSPNATTQFDATGLPLNARRIAVHLVDDTPIVLLRENASAPLRGGPTAQHPRLRLLELADDSNLSFRLDGDGSVAWSRVANASYQFDLNGLAPGRHHLMASASGAALDVPLDIGATVGLALGDIEGPPRAGHALAAISSTGTLPLGRVLLLIDGLSATGNATVTAQGIVRGQAPIVGGRTILALDPPLAGNESAALDLSLDSAPGDDAGPRDITFHAYALAGAYAA